MQEIAQGVIDHFRQQPVLALGISFIAGIAGNKTVAYHSTSRFFFHLVVGLTGFFLGQFVILFFGLVEYLEWIPDFRPLFDLIATYFGSFFVAALIYFIKPL